MKKPTVNTGFKIFVCISLIAVSAALPLDSKRDISGYGGVVMNADTPSEYVHEFSGGASKGYESSDWVVEEVYLTESQLQPLVETCKSAFGEHLGVLIPKNMEMGSFAYLDDDYGLSVSLEWTNLTETVDSDVETVWYSAQFRWMDIEQGTATLSWITCHNGFDKKRIEKYERMAVDGFERQLGLIMPDDYALVTAELHKFFLPPYDNTHLELCWNLPDIDAGRMNMEFEDKSARITDSYGDSYMVQTQYEANFADIDLNRGTGRLKGLFKNGSYYNVFNVYGREFKINLPPVFTDEQKAFMLEETKRFAREQRFELGELRLENPCNLGGVYAMNYAFHAESSNGTQNGDISFYITEEGKVIGYFY